MQEEQERRARLWDRSGVPYRHAKAKPSEDPGPWRDTFQRLQAELGSGFLHVLMGKRGSGKTQIGVSLIRSCCTLMRPARYVKAMEIFVAIRAAYRKDGDTESDIVDEFLRPDLLVIDALEERGETAFEDRMLNHILDRRYDNMSDTLLITNQSAEGFAQSMGPSIVSRIHETGDKIVCDWESFRESK